ncbi:hypothetical protein BT63DRAFT_455157 [Microthyrium microscopicum]|uniref:Cytochrome P450 n=1 Tax=Microthyrium microscopicum TaxID=703497 RepID=A0A6A6UC58_9PEZI|nr:hypothetical protein BT63DRAFT_455157 [Microthyrium microscopicum]
MPETTSIELPAWLSSINVTTAILAAFITAFVLSTRIITAFQAYAEKEASEKGQRPPQVPYWVPLFGSLPSFWLGSERFLSQKKDEYPQGLFSVKQGSRTKIYIYGSTLSKDVLSSDNASKLDKAEPTLRLLQSGFGMPLRYSTKFMDMWPEFRDNIQSIDQEFGKKLETDAIKSLERQMPDMISFSTSPIDQHQWERVSGTWLLEDMETTETGLMAIVQTFLTYFTTSQLLSSGLFEQTPELVPLILTLPSELDKLLHKSRLISPRSTAVLRTLSTHIGPFLDAVYATEEQQRTMTEYDEVPTTDSPFIAILQTPGMRAAPESMQAAVMLYLLAMSIIPHTIVGWAILQIITPSTKLHGKFSKGLEEVVQTLVSAHQEPGIGAFKPPATVEISSKLPAAESLNGLFTETIDLYERGWTEFDVKDDITISSEPKEKGDTMDQLSSNKQRWHLRPGDTIVVAPWLAGKSAHGGTSEEVIEHAVKAAIEQLGDFHMPALASYLTTVYTSFLVTFFKLYTVEPVDPEGLKVPESNYAPGLALPKTDIRVHIRSRDYDADGKEVKSDISAGASQDE